MIVVLFVVTCLNRLPPCGGSGLKFALHSILTITAWSPSMRREWIEIGGGGYITLAKASPSMRREWIEISAPGYLSGQLLTSPSMRREWIEIFQVPNC